MFISDKQVHIKNNKIKKMYSTLYSIQEAEQLKKVHQLIPLPTCCWQAI